MKNDLYRDHLIVYIVPDDMICIDYVEKCSRCQQNDNLITLYGKFKIENWMIEDWIGWNWSRNKSNTAQLVPRYFVMLLKVFVNQLVHNPSRKILLILIYSICTQFFLNSEYHFRYSWILSKIYVPNIKIVFWNTWKFSTNPVKISEYQCEVNWGLNISVWRMTFSDGVIVGVKCSVY